MQVAKGRGRRVGLWNGTMRQGSLAASSCKSRCSASSVGLGEPGWAGGVGEGKRTWCTVSSKSQKMEIRWGREVTVDNRSPMWPWPNSIRTAWLNSNLSPGGGGRNGGPACMRFCANLGGPQSPGNPYPRPISLSQNFRCFEPFGLSLKEGLEGRLCGIEFSFGLVPSFDLLQDRRERRNWSQPVFFTRSLLMV